MVRHALRAAAFSNLFIAIAAAAGMLLPVAPGTAWARLIVVLAATVGAVVFAVRAVRASSPAFDAFLETVEERFPKVRSWLRNGLDFEAETPEHGSIELARAVSDQTAERLATVPVQTLTPKIEPRRPTLLMLGALVLLVVLAVASPIRLQQSWTTLWNPALAAPPVELSVEPGDVEVTPGAALAVRARVWGTANEPQLDRDDASDDATLEGIDDDGARVWRFDLSQLTKEQNYQVSVSHVRSPEYTISMAGEPQPLSFTFEYTAPSYARLPVQRGASTRGDLAALAGTEARIEVTFDRDLESVSALLRASGATEGWTAVTPRRWSGTIPVNGDGEYELHAKAESGEGRFAYRISALDDAPPILTVVTPEGDMDLPTGQQIPMEIVGQDDLGLSELRLQYRKDPSADWTTKTLSRFSGEPREARVSSRWDASDLALLPGETATFRFELFDGNRVTGRGRAVSPTFELRFPSMAELYEDIDGRQENVQKSLEDVAERAKELQESLDKLSRQPQRATPNSTPSFERAEEMKKALEHQKELSEQIDDAAEQLRESLEDAAEREAFDEELQRRMQELNALMEQIQSPELRQAMDRMQQALENMDQNQLERNLPNLQKQNEEMLAHLDRSIELLKRLREEERMQSLAKRAEELKEEQDRLNREHEESKDPKDGESENSESSEGDESSDEQNEESDSEGSEESSESQEGQNQQSQEEQRAQRQEEAAERTEQLAEDMQEMSEQLSDESEKQQMEQMSEQLEREAAEKQRQAAEQTRQQQSQKARKSGKRASEQLGDVATQMQQMMEQRQQQQEGLDLALLRRSAKDLVSLQRSAEDNLEALHDLPGRADRQTDLAEGVSRVSDSLFTLAQRTPFITQDLAQSLGRAMRDLENSGRELGLGNRRNGENLGLLGAQSLTEAILELRKSEDAMCNNPGGGGGSESQSTAERLGAVGEQQSRLNGETRSLAQRLSEQLRMGAGDAEEMKRIAEQQAQIRKRLEEIEEDDEEEQKLLGKLDAAKREMEEVEEALRQGTTPNDLEQKQQRILSRLLDAQRSVHRRDYDPEREAQRAEDVLQPSPPELSQDLLKQSDRLRLDMLKAEADRYPAEYRAFIEAYLRSLNGTRQ